MGSVMSIGIVHDFCDIGNQPHSINRYIIQPAIEFAADEVVIGLEGSSL